MTAPSAAFVTEIASTVSDFEAATTFSSTPSAIVSDLGRHGFDLRR